MTYREKTLWLLLVGLLGTYGYYFTSVLPGHSDNVAPQQVMTLIGMTVLLVVTQIAGGILLAIEGRREVARGVQSDERDRTISYRSVRISSYLLASGVFSSLCVALMTPGNFAFVHVLLASWLAAQVVEILTQLVLYRRGC